MAIIHSLRFPKLLAACLLISILGLIPSVTATPRNALNYRTNAARFAAGLPPLPPKKRSPTGVRPRVPQASPNPCGDCTSNEYFVELLMNDVHWAWAIPNNDGGIIWDVTLDNTAPRAVVSLPQPHFVQLVNPSPNGANIYVGVGSQGRSLVGTGQDIIAGTATVHGEAATTPAGSSPNEANVNFYQSAIWDTECDAGLGLLLWGTWIQPNDDAVTLSWSVEDFQVRAWDPHLYQSHFNMESLWKVRLVCTDSV